MKITGKKALLSAGTAVGIVFSLYSPIAQASTIAETGQTNAVSQVAGNVDKIANYPDIEGEALDVVRNAALDASVKTAVLKDGQTLANEPHVAKRLDDGSAFVSIRIDGASNGSMFGVFLTPENTLKSTYQITLEEESPNSGWVTSYADGEQELHEYVVSQDTSATDDQISPMGMDWGGLNDCLSNAGIASWAIAALSVVCGAACAATLGAGCMACLVAASGATGGTIGYCAGQNWS